MKKILVLGASRGQVNLINEIKKFGYEPIVVSIDGNYPGLNMGCKVRYADIRDKDAVLSIAKEEKIDAVVTACLDLGIESLGYVCDKLNLNGLTYEASKICSDKRLMKKILVENDVNTAKYVSGNKKENLLNEAKTLKLPLIVKSSDLQGSQGISIVNDKGELENAVNFSISQSFKGECVIEEFIGGIEFGAQAFVEKGEIIYYLPHSDETIKTLTNIPIGHFVPCDMSNEILSKSKVQVERAIRATGLDNCAVNVDLIASNDEVYVIELTGRIGANGLDELISRFYGIDVYKMIINEALGYEVKEYFQINKRRPIAVYSKMIKSQQEGVVKSVVTPCETDKNIKIEWFVSSGDMTHEFMDSRDCVGQIIVEGDSVGTCKSKMEKLIEQMQIIY